MVEFAAPGQVRHPTVRRDRVDGKSGQETAGVAETPGCGTMRGVHAAMALALAGLMLAEGGPAGGHLAGLGGVRSVQRLRGGQEEKKQKVGRKVIPWQHRIKDIFGVHNFVVKGVPYNKRGFGTNITEDSFFIPKGPKMNRVANTPKRFRLNTIFKNMTHCAQSREDPGGMDELVRAPLAINRRQRTHGTWVWYSLHVAPVLPWVAQA